jgi:hypothetical protein
VCDMETLESASKSSVGAKLIVLVIFLCVWLVVGGMASLGPLLSSGIERVVGVFPVRGAIYSWALLPVTFLLWLFSSSNTFSYPLVFNIIVWIGLTAYVWKYILSH